MLRTFTTEALDAMCRTRPEGYRKDILSVAMAVPGQPGIYRVDTDLKAYTDIVKKYSTRMVPDGQPPPPKPEKLQGPTLTPKYDRLPPVTAVVRDMMELRMEGILAILGPNSLFASACKSYNEAKLRGGCTGCRRGGQLERLLVAFKRNVLTADLPTKQAIRQLFQDTEYLELRPVVMKWSDLIADPKEKENVPSA